MAKKEIAVTFLKMAASGNVQSAYDKFVAPHFIHHNQYFKGDRQSLMAAMEEASKTSPNKSIEIEHVYEDDDTVVTHSRVVRQNPADLNIAVIHIFRMENGQIVELWDVGQPISKDSPNENGMF